MHLPQEGELKGGFAPAYSAGGAPVEVPWLQTPACGAVLAQTAREHRPILHLIHHESGGSETALVFPIERGTGDARRVTSILVLHRDGHAIFSDHDVQILHTLAPKLAASIENARQFRRAEKLIPVDPSTGIANTRSLFVRLDAELARARRSQSTLAVLTCSVHGFDQSGRLCSDAATRSAFEKVAGKLRENCREYDFTARSGDELVLVLPDFRREFVQEKRGLIQKIVEDAGVNAGLPLFAVVGAAFFPDDGTDAEDLLACASNRSRLY